MTFLSFLHRYGLWMSALLFFTSAVLLGFFIRQLIRLVRQAHILSVPLLEEQEIDLGNARRVVLCLEGPRLTPRFAKLEYELRGPYGMSIEGRRILFRLRTSGGSRVRLTERSYEIPEPGRHVLRIKGLQHGVTPDPHHRIVFMRPHLAGSIGLVLGIVLTSLLLIGSTVFVLMRLT